MRFDSLLRMRVALRFIMADFLTKLKEGCEEVEQAPAEVSTVRRPAARLSWAATVVKPLRPFSSAIWPAADDAEAEVEIEEYPMPSNEELEAMLDQEARQATFEAAMRLILMASQGMHHEEDSD